MESIHAAYAGVANRVGDQAETFRLIQERLAREQQAASAAGPELVQSEVEVVPVQYQWKFAQYAAETIRKGRFLLADVFTEFIPGPNTHEWADGS